MARDSTAHLSLCDGLTYSRKTKQGQSNQKEGDQLDPIIGIVLGFVLCVIWFFSALAGSRLRAAQYRAAIETITHRIVTRRAAIEGATIDPRTVAAVYKILEKNPHTAEDKIFAQIGEIR